MTLKSVLRCFNVDESGAVTVDWVVLTGSIVFLGAILGFLVGDGINVLAVNVGADIAARDVVNFTYGNRD